MERAGLQRQPVLGGVNLLNRFYQVSGFEPPSFGVTLTIAFHVAGNGAVADFV
jgi:hypothetical protein